MTDHRQVLYEIKYSATGIPAFFPKILLPLFLAASLCHIVGAILGSWYPLEGRVLSTSGALLYRFWLVREWAGLLRGTIQEPIRQPIIWNLLIRVAAFGVCILGYQSSSRWAQLHVLSSSNPLHESTH